MPNFKETLAHLPAQILYELARNEAAQLKARVAAVELLLESNDRRVHLPDIEALVIAVRSNQAKPEKEPPIDLDALHDLEPGTFD